MKSSKYNRSFWKIGPADGWSKSREKRYFGTKHLCRDRFSENLEQKCNMTNVWCLQEVLRVSHFSAFCKFCLHRVLVSVPGWCHRFQLSRSTCSPTPAPHALSTSQPTLHPKYQTQQRESCIRKKNPIRSVKWAEVLVLFIFPFFFWKQGF